MEIPYILETTTFKRRVPEEMTTIKVQICVGNAWCGKNVLSFKSGEQTTHKCINKRIKRNELEAQTHP